MKPLAPHPLLPLSPAQYWRLERDLALMEGMYETVKAAISHRDLVRKMTSPRLPAAKALGE